MSESWFDQGMRIIAALDGELPATLSLPERKKAIQKGAWYFHQGTSWGKKVWPKVKRAYFAGKYGDRPPKPRGIPAGHLSPLERLMAKSAHPDKDM